MKVNDNSTDNQEELFIVVDKNDKVLEYRTRYECHRNKKLIHRAVGIIIFNSDGKILVQKRSKNKDTHPGFYTLSASGHVVKGQTYKQTALRELDEEIGIITSLKKERKFLFEGELETEIDCLFTGKHNGPFDLNLEEVDEVKFVSKTELKKMKTLLTPFAQDSFKQINLL